MVDYDRLADIGIALHHMVGDVERVVAVIIVHWL
jgi:hypothetical protein